MARGVGDIDVGAVLKQVVKISIRQRAPCRLTVVVYNGRKLRIGGLSFMSTIALLAYRYVNACDLQQSFIRVTTINSISYKPHTIRL